MNSHEKYHIEPNLPSKIYTYLANAMATRRQDFARRTPREDFGYYSETAVNINNNSEAKKNITTVRRLPVFDRFSGLPYGFGRRQ